MGHHRKKYSRLSDLAPGICARLGFVQVSRRPDSSNTAFTRILDEPPFTVCSYQKNVCAERVYNFVRDCKVIPPFLR